MSWIYVSIVDIYNSDIESTVFEAIAEKGPISVYEASDKKDPNNPSFASVHRHFKNLEEEKLITIYAEGLSKNGRPKKLYGPTFEGIIEFYFDDEGIPDQELGSVFKKWAKQKKFFESEQGPVKTFDYDDYKKNPDKVFEVFKKLVKFYKKSLLESEKPIPDEMKIHVGMLIYSMKNQKEYLETIEYLYKESKAFRAGLDLSAWQTSLFQTTLNKFKTLPTSPHKTTKILLKGFEPMLTQAELDKIRFTEDEPKFDVTYKHIQGKETMWGPPVIEFKDVTLTELANNTYDYIEEDYEMWINDAGLDIIDVKNMKYAMVHCADNFQGDAIALAFNIESQGTSGKIKKLAVKFDPYSDVSGPIAQEFYDNFEIFVPNMENSPNTEPVIIESHKEKHGIFEINTDIEFPAAEEEVIEKHINLERKKAEKRWKEHKEKIREKANLLN